MSSRGPDWDFYQCKCGNVLFEYNVVTGEKFMSETWARCTSTCMQPVTHVPTNTSPFPPMPIGPPKEKVNTATETDEVPTGSCSCTSNSVTNETTHLPSCESTKSDKSAEPATEISEKKVDDTNSTTSNCGDSIAQDLPSEPSPSQTSTTSAAAELDKTNGIHVDETLTKTADLKPTDSLPSDAILEEPKIEEAGKSVCETDNPAVLETNGEVEEKEDFKSEPMVTEDGNTNENMSSKEEEATKEDADDKETENEEKVKTEDDKIEKQQHKIEEMTDKMEEECEKIEDESEIVENKTEDNTEKEDDGTKKIETEIENEENEIEKGESDSKTVGIETEKVENEKEKEEHETLETDNAKSEPEDTNKLAVPEDESVPDEPSEENDTEAATPKKETRSSTRQKAKKETPKPQAGRTLRKRKADTGESESTSPRTRQQHPRRSPRLNITKKRKTR